MPDSHTDELARLARENTALNAEIASLRARLKTCSENGAVCKPAEEVLHRYEERLDFEFRAFQEQSQQKIRLLTKAVEQSPDIVVVTDTHGAIEYVNPSFTESTGYSFEEVVGRNPRILKSGETPPEVYKNLWQTITSGHVWRGEFHNKKKSGELYWESVVISPITDESGKIIKFLAIKEEISERKRMEGELKRREELYRNLFNAITDAVFVHGFTPDGKPGCFLEVNGVACKRLGYTREELLSKGPMDIDAPEATISADSQIFEKIRQGRDVTFEQIHLAKDGRSIPVEIHAQPITYEGQPAVIALARDITERRKAGEAIRASEARFKSIFNEAPLGIAIVDSLNARFYSVNPMFAKIAGRTVAELEQIDWVSITHPGDIAADREKMALMNAGKIPGFQTEKRYLRPDGSSVWINITVAPMDVADKAHPRHLLMVEEIAERKRMEEGLRAAIISAEGAKEAAEEASRAKDHFLAILSHELRTPLTPVLAIASEMAEDTSLSSGLRRNLSLMQRNVELEARLIDDLLDTTRIVHRKTELTKHPVELCEILRMVVDVCMPDLRVRHIHFEVKKDQEHYSLLGDATRLQQVFWNLLKNALKFTPEKGCIGIECRRDGSHVSIEVTDSGKGIAPEDLGRIFHPFEQIERRENGAYGGLGLGLTISKSLVELHGGTIEARSKGLGKGATFCVTLPLSETAHPQPTFPASEPPPSTTRKLNILLVEDHGDTARVLARLIQSQGHEVHTVGDIQQALELGRRGSFDVVVSDLGLPDGNGRDLFPELQRLHPGIVGIAISGFGTDEDIQQSLGVGFEEHLVKPLNIATLRAAIQRIAGRTR